MTASDTAAPPAADEDTQDRLTPDLIKLAGVIVIGVFAVQMDGTMVNVALQTLSLRFDMTVAGVQWITTAYLLALATVIPLAGWAVDRFGQKPVWLAALSVFLLGSALCCAAWSGPTLIAFRVVQGVGGGIMLPLTQSILAQAAGPKRIGRVVAIVGVPFLIGPIVGPVVGGLVVQYLGWRWIFAINIPISLIGLLLALLVMPDIRGSVRSRLDVRGLILLAPGLAALVYGLSLASKYGGFGVAPVLGTVGAGLVLVGGFTVHALRTRDEPLTDPRLFRTREFTAASILLFLVIISMLGMMLLIPLYDQMIRDNSALHAGLLLAPEGLGAAVTISISGKLADRFDPRPIAFTGVLLTVAGLYCLTRIQADTSTLRLCLELMLCGAGFGAVIVPATTAPYKPMAHDVIPRATVSLRIVQQVGASFGVAVLAVVLQNGLTAAVHQLIIKPTIMSPVIATAYSHTFRWAVIITAFALPASLFLAGGRSARTAADAAPAPAATPTP